MGWLKYMIDEEKQWLKDHEQEVTHAIGELPIKKSPAPPRTPSVTEVPHHNWFEDYNKRS